MNEKTVSQIKVPLITSIVSYSSAVLFYPLEVIATVVKVRPEKIRLKRAISIISPNKTYQPFFKGINTVFLEVFPPSFIYFFSYSILNEKMSLVFEKNNIESRWVIPVITSFIAEAVSTLFLVPINLIQTRIQSGQLSARTGNIEALSSVIQEEGFLRLFKASPHLIFLMLSFTTLQFSFYEWGKKLYKEWGGRKEFTVFDSVMVTAVATVFASGLTNPLDTLVTRFQCEKFVSKEGLNMKGLWRRDYGQFGFVGINRGFQMKILMKSKKSTGFFLYGERIPLKLFLIFKSNVLNHLTKDKF